MPPTKSRRLRSKTQFEFQFRPDLCRIIAFSDQGILFPESMNNDSINLHFTLGQLHSQFTNYLFAHTIHTSRERASADGPNERTIPSSPVQCYARQRRPVAGTDDDWMTDRREIGDNRFVWNLFMRNKSQDDVLINLHNSIQETQGQGVGCCCCSFSASWNANYDKSLPRTVGPESSLSERDHLIYACDSSQSQRQSQHTRAGER